jgi:hypothetical protein
MSVTDVVNGETVRQGRPPGARNKRTAELWDLLEKRGDRDPIEFLSQIVSDNTIPLDTRREAARDIAPYRHSKCQPVPTPRYIDEPIEVPEFTSVAVAESFLVYLNRLYCSGTHSAESLEPAAKMTLGWIRSQYAKQGIDLKAQAQGATDTDTVIRIEGGLPSLPGTNVTMPPRELINGSNSGYAALPDPHTLNPSSIDGVHAADPTAANAAVEPDPKPE